MLSHQEWINMSAFSLKNIVNKNDSLNVNKSSIKYYKLNLSNKQQDFDYPFMFN